MNKLKEIWLVIWKYLKLFLTVKGIISFLTSKTFLVLLIILIVLGFGRSCAKLRDQVRVQEHYEQNIAALQDSVKNVHKQNGVLEASVVSYVASEKELKKLNKELYDQVRKEEGQVVSLTNMVMVLKQDTNLLRRYLNYLESVVNEPIKLNDSTFAINWQLSYSWGENNFDFYRGQTLVGLKTIPDNMIALKHYKTELIERQTQIELTFKQKVENGLLNVYIDTKYPGFSAKSLQGVFIDPNNNPYIRDIMKKKRWIPNTWSVGVGPTFGFDFLSRKPYLGLGVNVNYNLLQW